MKKTRYIPYGYTMRNGRTVISTEEAEIIREIFKAYLDGASLKAIAEELTGRQIPYTQRTTTWDKARIARIIDNAKYIGTEEYDPIIDEDMYEAAVSLKTARQCKACEKENDAIGLLRDFVRCDNCGQPMKRRVNAKHRIRESWNCTNDECGIRVHISDAQLIETIIVLINRIISRLDYGKKYCSDSPTIMEDKLQEAIVRAVNKFNKQDNATYKALMRATISEALGLNGDPEEVDMLERKVEALNNKMLALVNESVSSGDGIEAHESEFMTLSQETELLKQRIAAIQESTAKDNGEQSRLEQIQAIISERESKCMEYDDSIVRQMVECIKVYPGGKLEIIFGGGYLVEESV